MKISLPIVLFFLFTLVACQKKQLNQEELAIKLNNDWCNCMEDKSKEKTPEEIISQVSVSCTQSVLLTYTQDEQLYDNIRKLTADKGYDDSLSDYEKERLFGNELGQNLINEAVDNCVIYRQALIEFKKQYADKAKQNMNYDDKVETDKLINNMQSELDEINIDQVKNSQTIKQISNYYILLGLLYENAGRKAPAIEQYNKAILIDPENSKAATFKKLLVDYNNN